MITKITTEAHLRSRPDIIEMLNNLAVESEESLDRNLRSKGARLARLASRNETWQVNEEFISTFEDNKITLYVAEDETRPLALIGCIDNNEEIAARLGIDNNYVMFFKALTQRDCRGAGLFRELLTEAMKDRQDKQVIGCVSFKKAVTDEGVEFDHVMNLEMYGSMMLKLFPDSKIQVRYQSPGGRQYGREKFDLKDFIENRTTNQNSIQALIDSRRDTQPDKKMIGFYIHSR